MQVILFFELLFSHCIVNACFAVRPGIDYVGVVHAKHIYEIAKIKQSDAHMQHIPLDSIARCIVGSCRTSGLKIVDGRESPAELAAVLASITGSVKPAKGGGKDKDKKGGKK